MNDFDDLQDDDFGFDDDFSASPDQDDTDEFSQLRRSSARRETMDSGLSDESISTTSSGSSGFSLSNFSAGQRVILAILVLLDIVVIGVGLMVVLGAIG